MSCWGLFAPTSSVQDVIDSFISKSKSRTQQKSLATRRQRKSWSIAPRPRESYTPRSCAFVWDFFFGSDAQFCVHVLSLNMHFYVIVCEFFCCHLGAQGSHFVFASCLECTSCAPSKICDVIFEQRGSGAPSDPTFYLCHQLKELVILGRDSLGRESCYLSLQDLSHRISQVIMNKIFSQ